jgi:hypothetical protein
VKENSAGQYHSGWSGVNLGQRKLSFVYYGVFSEEMAQLLFLL